MASAILMAVWCSDFSPCIFCHHASGPRGDEHNPFPNAGLQAISAVGEHQNSFHASYLMASIDRRISNLTTLYYGQGQ